MTTCLVGFISLLGSLSCSGPDPIGPRQDTLRPAPMLAVGSAGPCARVHVQIVGGTTAQASFAADSGCATGLALVGAGAVGYVKNQRKVSIPVRVVNRGPGGRDAPILVVLPRDSGVVTAPSNITARVVESNADSVGAAGGADAGAALWTFLETGGTIPGDSTPIRTLQLVVPNKTTAARLSFEIRAELPDSALPIIHDQMTFAAESLYVIEDSLAPGYDYYRRMIGVWLRPGADGTDFRALLQKYNANLAGGSNFVGLYILRFPDPGPTWTDVKALLDSLHREPIVRVAGPVTRRGGPGRVDGRYPTDGGFTRQSWIQRAIGLWAPLAIRAPLAWGCENGRYSGSTPPLVYQLEAEVPSGSVPADLASYSGARAPFPPSGQEVSEAQRTMDIAADSLAWAGHAAAVSSLLAARAENGLGIAGMVWGGGVRAVGIGARNYVETGTAGTALVNYILPLLASESPRVVVSTTGIGLSNDTLVVEYLRIGLADLFARVPGLLWVQATGNERLNRSLADLQAQPIRSAAMDRVLLELRSQGFADRILFVAGTEPGNTAWLGTSPGSGSGFYLGNTTIAAPAEDVWAATTNGTLAFGNGTSFAVPLVAGTAALLLARDPSLTPAQLVDYLERGSRVAVRDSVTGLLVPRAPVEGFPEPVYQLDAYGALQLLSQDRGDNPLCGQQVLANPPVSFSVLRDFEIARSTPIAHAQWYPARVSVAPGGRQLSVHLNEDQLNGGDHSVATFDPLGARLRTWNNHSARFDGDDVFALQRSTLTAYFVDLYSQATGGLLSSVLLTDSTGGAAYVWPDDVRLHPQGRYLFYRGLLFDLRTGASTRFTPISTPAWDLSPDGSRLVALERLGAPNGPWSSRLLEFRVAVNPDSTLTITGPHQDVLIPGVRLGGPFHGDEGRIVATSVIEEPTGQCTIHLRPATALGTVAETRFWPATSCPASNGLSQASEVRDVAARGP